MSDVWNTIENMRRLDTSISSFFDVLEEELENEGPLIGTDPNNAGTEYTDKGWCCYAEYRRYRLKKMAPNTGKYRIFGNLTVGVELWREVDEPSAAWCHAREPLIYVGFTPGRDSDNYWDQAMALDYRGSPLPAGEGDRTVEPTEMVPWLWLWEGDESEEERWDRRNWFFMLRLFDINSKEALQLEIIEPLENLLADGLSPYQAFRSRKAITLRPDAANTST